MSRAKQLFESAMAENHRRTSRLFAALMCAQWLFGVLVSLLWSPLAWAGRSSTVHVHVYTAMLLGALISSAPIYLALTRPSAQQTRYVIACGQMLWSALLIHLTGGRIETHFHVFGSLAFLAFYRDFKVLVPATVVVAGDHFLRGLFWPESVYGVSNPEWWRFVEHALWVMFEDTVVVLGCLRGTAEARAVADRQAEAEASLQRVNELNRELDHRVAERTAHLEKAQAELLEASRRAGKADVATAVLHNVGNALNSINVSCSVVVDTLGGSRLPKLRQASALLGSADVAPLLVPHAKARKLPEYLEKLSQELEGEHGVITRELGDLQRNIEHVKVIVGAQQTHAKSTVGVLEAVPFSTLVEDAVRLSSVAREGAGVEVKTSLEVLPPSLIDRHKFFQILMNLISNARHAIKETGRPGTIEIGLTRRGDMARLTVRDDGCGIAEEDLARIFNLGFTTKKEGHGFGLHSSACAALELGGRLSAESEGRGKGANFVLELPFTVERKAA